MALINCTECGCVLSEYADKCSKCGCPTKIILENIQKKRVAESPALEKDINEQEAANTCSVIIDSSGKQKKLFVAQTSLRNKWVIVLGILILCVSLFIVIISKPSIADVSIDRVTPDLKNAVQKYDELNGFHEGLAAVCKDGKWGFIDKLGKEIISCKYDEVNHFQFGVCVVESNEKSGIIDKYGKSIIPIKYDWIDGFSFSNDSLSRASLNGRQGILNVEGKVVIPFEYEEIFDFKEGLVLARKDDKYGCIDKSNNVIIPFEYQSAGAGNEFSEGLIALQKDGKFGYLDKKGNVVIGFDEKYTGYPFLSGYSTISKGGFRDVVENGKISIIREPYMTALINRLGQQVTEFYEGDYKGFYKGYCVVESGITRRQGLIDSHGNLILPVKYQLIAVIKDGLVHIIDEMGKAGFVNLRTGQFTIPCEYDSQSGLAFYEGLCCVKNSEKWGFINMDNQLVIQYIYDWASDFNEGFAIVKRYGKYGYVDRYGTDTFS